MKKELIQGGFNAEDVRQAGFEGVLFMDGEPYRQPRAAIAKFLSLTTVRQAYLPLIEKTADELITEFEKTKLDFIHLNIRFSTDLQITIRFLQLG